MNNLTHLSKKMSEQFTNQMTNFSPFKCKRLRESSVFIRAKMRFGTRVVDDITSTIHDQENKSFREAENQTEDLLRVILELQDLVDKYYKFKEKYKDYSVIVPSFEEIKKQLVTVGRALEEGGVDMFETLTCSVPLFRTISSLCIKLQKELETNDG